MADNRQVRQEIEHLTDAIASGVLRTSPALAARLAKAESELEKPERASELASEPTRSLPRIENTEDGLTSFMRFRNGGDRGRLRLLSETSSTIRKRLGGQIVFREAPNEIQ